MYVFSLQVTHEYSLTLVTLFLLLSLSLLLDCCRLLQLQRSVISSDLEIPDELLYGRAGFLYALLFVNKEIGPDTVDESTIAKVNNLY